MADSVINFNQKQAYSIAPTRDDGSPGTVEEVVWSSDSDGVDIFAEGDGMTAFAVPDTDFVSTVDVTITVQALGKDGVLLTESKTLQVTAPVEDTGATALNLTVGEASDK